MIPILLPKDITPENYKSMGLGLLKETKKCLVTEERNGAFTLSLTYSGTGELRDKITRDSYIVASAPYHRRRTEYQLFKVSSILRETDGDIEIEGEHISYLLEDLPFFPPVLNLENVNATEAMTALRDKAMIPTAFQFRAIGYGSERNSFSFDLSRNPSIRKALGGSEGSLLTHFNGEYLCLNYKIYLMKERALNKGRSLVYGRDIVSAEFEDDVSNLYNAILPFAKTEDGRVITLPERALISEEADSAIFSRLVCKAVEFEEVKTEEALRKKAMQYIKANQIGFPNLHIKVKLSDLKDVPDFNLGGSLAPPELCEEVRVFVPFLGLNLKTKIIEVVWDSLRDEINAIKLGTVKKGLNEVLSSASNEASKLERVKTELSVKADKYIRDRATNKRYEWKMTAQDGVAKIELVEVE